MHTGFSLTLTTTRGEEDKVTKLQKDTQVAVFINRLDTHEHFANSNP